VPDGLREVSAGVAVGFDENTIRTVSENSRTLKYEQVGFKAE
jgi:hypothetical protein